MYQRPQKNLDILPVDEIMRRWPTAIRIFLDFRMACVGCPIGSFHTVEDACREHGVELESFVRRLNCAVAGGQS